MSLEFRKRIITSEFESPFEDFQTVKVKGEIRVCPLSGHVTRLLPARLKEFSPVDWTPIIKRSQELGCPFCPQSIEARTPRFPGPYGVEKGRIRIGDTVVFPNAFPYDDHCAVVVFTKEHYLSPGQFMPSMLQEGLRACLLYFQKAAKVVPEAKQAMLNWNYMPLAGAGLIHPHFQTAFLPEMTPYYRLILDKQSQYLAAGGNSIFATLVMRESEKGERYIAPVGKWHWMTAFAPRGIYEFWAVFNPNDENQQVQDQDLADLAQGIVTVLRFFEVKRVQGFNLSWYFIFNPPVAGMCHWVSIVPRVNFPLFGTSDVNYFDRLHGESITFAAPEEVTREIRESL
jgi:UDPglucose--hexose-1-phosphate uridylyltransferase